MSVALVARLRFRPVVRRPSSDGGLLTLAVLTLVLLVPIGEAGAAGPERSSLCDGATSCAVGADGYGLTGQSLTVSVYGNRNAEVSLQLYLVEFNRDGALTALVPTGEEIPVSVYPQPTTVRVPLVVTPSSIGGWAYVGLAEEAGQSVKTRLGSFLGFGGTALKLLGDGYAEQKPAGVELDLQVVGQVPSIGYWVEYRDAAGTWREVPGHGYSAPQELTGEPHEIAHLSYAVPTSLTPGKRHQFRINSRLNYVGGRLIVKPTFTSWTVIPSATPVGQERASNFDPNKEPGVPDPTHAPTGQPTAAPTSAPTGPPQGGGGSSPSGAEGPGSPAGDGPTPAPSPAAPPSSPPSSGLGPQATGGKPAPSATPTMPQGAVWGKEELGEPELAARPVDDGTSALVAAGGLLLLLGPALCWLYLRWRGQRATAQETL